MILTVTPNPALDQTMVVPGFTVGKTNRVALGRVEVGGKGINVARAVRRLGCDVAATGFLADDRASEIVGAIGREGIATRFVTVSGRTRVNLKLIDPTSGIETEINEPGFDVPPSALDLLVDEVKSLLPGCRAMICSGSLPPGVPSDFYAVLIRLAAEAGAITLLDTSGAPLRSGLGARPHLVKPNRAEAEEVVGRPLEDEAALLAAALDLQRAGARRVVISIGAAGALSASPDGIWRGRVTADLTSRTSVGAGDSMVAAFAYAVTRSLAAPDALRLAIAAGAAAATLGTRCPNIGEIESLASRVTIEQLLETGQRWGGLTSAE